jgi:hypothetical protein
MPNPSKPDSAGRPLPKVAVAKMVSIFRTPLSVLGILPVLTGVAISLHAESEQAGVEFFENRVRPRLVEYCFDCHSEKAPKIRGGLRLDTREAFERGGDSGSLLSPGDPEHSKFLQAIRHANPDVAMPRGSNGPIRLPALVTQDLTRWIEMGAPYPSGQGQAKKGPGNHGAHWSFQPVQNPSEPAVRDRGWLKTSIDSFILAKLEAQGSRPSSPADRRALLRRATFDLTGLPPTAAETEAFLQDTSPDAFARVVDRLLDSPRYGEHWGRHWLDVVRYADTAGETADYPVPVAWRYRNWVIDAFNADKPYDDFLREQIAGDILARRGPPERYAGRVTATGYLAISRRFGFDSENYHHLTIQDTIDTLGQSVLGLTLGCARCHAHKFDPISMPDYYALYGIFESTRYAFPGSEQKQKHRALVPLVPPEQAQPQWRSFEAKVAALTRKITRADQSAPGATLRSLDEMDGDFEMQAPAAGGSKGVLVPPWVYDGAIAVTQEGQSPYRNFYSQGRVGASLPGGTNLYQIGQALHLDWSRAGSGRVYINLDFQVATNAPVSAEAHRFWIGGSRHTAAVDIRIGSESVSVANGGTTERIGVIHAGQWHNLQLAIDLKSRKMSGRLGIPGDVTEISERALDGRWDGSLAYVGLESREGDRGNRPGLLFDNLGIQATPVAPVSTVTPSLAAANAEPDKASLISQLKQVLGEDGEFELQTDGKPPAEPWGPGPNSVVMIRREAQSPFHNFFAPGRLGIRLPNSGAYNGFGQTLHQRWTAEKIPKLHASFDFRCVNAESGGGGSWRFYLGHGPGNSAAVELEMNADRFFKRSGGERVEVQSLKLGQWYQVQLQLDLKEKRYRGTIATPDNSVEFSGEFASGWDGSVDYTFVDSYGHLGGVKPALDVDNFSIRETPLILRQGEAEVADEGRLTKPRQLATELRSRIVRIEEEADLARHELEALLAEGPVDLAYAVSEGTPKNARVQLRGEPDRPGDMVQRGFLPILGGRRLPADTEGSGRLELADWLVNPANPLTARVMVNRIWQYHFGEGLVKTPNDFGTRGQPPTHPELLDHLASEFIRNRWSIKAMHRLILGSAAYQQSSEFARADEKAYKPEGVAGGPYSSFSRRRLGAEETRDAILSVCGTLDASPGGGHPFPAPTSWGFTQHGPFSAVYDHQRRSVYLMTQRIKRHPFLALFDGPDPNTSTAARRTTTVPTQALFFLNDPFVYANAGKLADQVVNTHSDESSRIEAAYERVLGRRPTELEKREAQEFLSAYRAELTVAKSDDRERSSLAAFARVLFGSNEFLTVD